MNASPTLAKAAKALEEISKRRNRELAQACSVYGSIEACTAKQNEAKQSVAYTKQQLAAIPSGFGKPSAPILQYLDKVGADHPISDGLIAVNRLKQMDALASSPEFIKAYQSDARVRKDFKNQVESLASIVQQSGRAKEGFMFDKEVPLTNISKLGGIRTGEVGLIPVYPEFELMGLGIGKATKTVAVKLLGSKWLTVGGKNFKNYDIDGLAYRIDLPKHLSGPDGISKRTGQLNGTHNSDQAIQILKSMNAEIQKIPTSTKGIYELSYSYINQKGKKISATKTVYDSSIHSDNKILELSQKAGAKGFEKYLINNGETSSIIKEGGINFKVYINIDPKTKSPYVGNVHPVK